MRNVYLIIVLNIILPLIGLSQSFNYLPTSTTGVIIEHSYYTLSYSEKDEQSEWVAYRLTDSMLVSIVERTDNFRPDPDISSGSSQLSDYKGSGYDRGHLCPAGDMSFSSTAMSESFYMSNMSPQEPSFNRGIWKNLETLVRNWAQEYEEIYVVTAGILSSNKSYIGNNVSIPRYYYKVILDFKEPEIKAIALLLPNQKGSKELMEYVVSIDSIETLTGIDFFPTLPDSIENILESRINIDSWNFNSDGKSTNIKADSVSTSVQCKGYTQQGERCKNKTTNANSYCYVHQSKANQTKTSNVTKNSTSVRCSATTQAGTRCKRMTKSQNGKCWQHGGN